jgi:lysophospholipase
MIAPLILSLLLSAAPAIAANAYAPVSATCPTTPLVRAASGLSDGEEAYRVARKAVADVALKAWLVKTNSAFGTGNLPTVSELSRTG